MTVANPENSNLPTVPDDLNTGLEDFGVEDAVVPRLQIVHREGVFKDSLSSNEYPLIKAVILGLVKQRILWHHKVDEGDRPMCKSPDHNFGFPNTDDEDTPKEKRFPWGKSGFDPADYPPNEEGFVQLPCERCALKDWGTHPDGNKPYCAEQYTLPLLYDPGTGGFVPAILSIQKTSIKGLRSYLTSFARSKNPAYTSITEIGLRQASRGTTDYSIATFKELGKTDPDRWREYSANYSTLRKFLTQHPISREEDDGAGPTSDNETKAPQTQPEVSPEPETRETTQPAAPAGGGSPSTKGAVPATTGDDDDDLPF